MKNNLVHQNKNIKLFLKATAYCAFLGALTTILLIFLPNPKTSDFGTRAALYNNGLYLTKQWILSFDPQLNILAAFGVAYLPLDNYLKNKTNGKEV